MSELEDLDEVIARGEAALAELRARRARLVGQAQVVGDVRDLARQLHANECNQSHEDRCAWEYEEDWLKKGRIPTGEHAETVWTEAVRTHHRWAKRAAALCVAQGQSARKVLEYEQRRHVR